MLLQNQWPARKAYRKHPSSALSKLDAIAALCIVAHMVANHTALLYDLPFRGPLAAHPLRLDACKQSFGKSATFTAGAARFENAADAGTGTGSGDQVHLNPYAPTCCVVVRPAEGSKN